VGDEAIEELLTCIPATADDEPITKHYLRAEMTGLRSELRGEMAELRSELRGEMAELRTELRSEMAELRTELRGEMAKLGSDLRGEMAELRVDFQKAMHRQTMWLIGAMFTFAGVLEAVGHFGPH
jgi:hypothetical protein